MMSHRCRHQERGSVLSRCLTSSTERWATARVTLAISFLLLAGNSHLLYSITECGLVLDNIEANGQTIKTPNAKTAATQLTFLGSSTNGPSEGTITITYTDGTSATAQLGFTDWTVNGGGGSMMYGNVVATKLPYRNSSGGTPDQTVTYIFATASVSLDSTKQVASITLPSSTNQGSLHIFALAIS